MKLVISLKVWFIEEMIRDVVQQKLHVAEKKCYTQTVAGNTFTVISVNQFLSSLVVLFFIELVFAVSPFLVLFSSIVFAIYSDSYFSYCSLGTQDSAQI